ncbi:25198_t:CDS:2 [Racocetra persica]|uniref:25198_t:CDS:1 n=1 Tax=Racocetra persica TaxID=160502 RepID=A0ACA9Q720_9GLOM|nr:25198_t:CDS:2 [Racocetra persica]
MPISTSSTLKSNISHSLPLEERSLPRRPDHEVTKIAAAAYID